MWDVSDTRMSYACAHIRVFIFSFIILLIIAAPSYADNKSMYPIGELVALEGNAYSVGQNGKRTLRQGDPIYFQGLIETGPDARALILFIDDTEVTIGGDASLQIDEFVFDPYDSEENRGELTFLKGPFLWTSGLIAKKDEPDLKLNNAYGSIGIRGTTVWGGKLSEGYGVYVADGRVNFSGDWGSADIPEGKGVFIGNGEQLGEAAPWKNDTVDKALWTISFRNIEKSALERQLKEMKKENIRKRHDYRGRMFPYKENPFRKQLKIEEDDFFTDEFEEMRNRQ